MSEFDPPPSDESQLEHIVDDATPWEESLTWAVAALRDGRPFEEVLAELQAGDWSTQDAEAIVEEARQQTRGERGAITRAEVARAVGANYRAGMGNGLLAGLPTIAALRRLLFSIATLKFLRRRGRSK